MAVKDPSGQIVHVSEPLTDTQYTFDLDTTGVDLTGALRFAVVASDGLNIRRSVNTATVLLEGTATERDVLPDGLALGALWPLPARQELHAPISGVRPSNMDWQLVDVIGRVVRSGRDVHTGGESTLTVDVAGLASGWYALRVATATGVLQRAFVVAR
ncbi:MAG: hypothetical protein O3C45_01205 [Bacteroidetes bacterium]|nr:hypothetical protein [Bacteroidota bacterium]MDA0873657.1 hypothetical protein [Bacteroidota bacterium]